MSLMSCRPAAGLPGCIGWAAAAWAARGTAARGAHASARFRACTLVHALALSRSLSALTSDWLSLAHPDCRCMQPAHDARCFASTRARQRKYRCMYVNFCTVTCERSEPMKITANFREFIAKFECKATKFAKETWVIFCETLVKPKCGHRVLCVVVSVHAVIAPLQLYYSFSH